ncbi:MFS general substrate transporter [Stemphylium lycopersici]|uniref:MFS general substrate transporter n=1 Tax=Stemphylium lycopersici TaxID=183478 RepID=A0A364NH87_STELY|nr:MFS general substrate transporter [Stemphylium lycopersici]
MTDLSHTRTHDSMLKNAARVSEDVEQDAAVAGSSSHSTGFGRDGSAGDAEADAELAAQGAQRGVAARWMKKIGGRSKRQSYSHAHYRVYKRRWVGLAQLVLLNIVVSWDWLTFAPISTTSSLYFNVSESSINWLSTAFLFAFAVSCPVTIYLLHRGPKPALLAASGLLLVGNWIRYAGTIANGGNFAVVMVGQIVTGLAQPFVLAAPTRYSDMWFTEQGRIGATAVASLANPFGAAAPSPKPSL